MPIIFPTFFNKVTPPERMVPYEKAAAGALDTFLEHWVANKPFIAGQNISAADLWAACEIEALPAVKIDPFADGRGELAKYIERVRNGAKPWYEESGEKIKKMLRAPKM